MSTADEAYTLRRRDHFGKGGALAVGLAQKEDAARISSAIAMLRIRQGTLKDAEWERMYAEYIALIRQPLLPKVGTRMDAQAVVFDEALAEARKRSAAVTAAEEELDA